MKARFADALKHLLVLSLLALTACQSGPNSGGNPAPAPAPGPAPPPPKIADTGDCVNEASLPNSRSTSDHEFRAYGFFEKGENTTVGKITDDQIKALDAEMKRLSSNSCYSLCVRVRATMKQVNQAMHDCDNVYLVNHGDAKSPYLPSGVAGDDTWKPQNVGPQTRVWFAACYGQSIVKAVDPKHTGQFVTAPDKWFDPNGTMLKGNMVEALTAELKNLNDAPPCEFKRKICILSGLSETHSIHK